MLKWLLGTLLALLIGTFMVLQLPCVQHRLLARLLQQLSHRTQCTITHQHFRLQWLHRATLTGLTIKDPQDNNMLVVERLSLRVNPLQLLLDRYVTLKTVSIHNAQLHLCKEGKAGYNLAVFLQRLLGDNNQQGAPFVVERAFLQDVELVLDDQQAGPGHTPLKVHQINAALSDLKAQANTFEVNIQRFACKHADKPFFIDHLSTALVVAPNRVQCKALNLRTARSTLQGSCTVTYAPAAFYDTAHIKASLDNAVLAAEELAIFLPCFKQHPTSYQLCGTLEGQLNDFHIKDLHLAFGERGSYLKGNLDLQGLPKLQETVFDLDLKQGVLCTEDLRPYLDEKHYKLIKGVTFVRPQGHVYGKRDDFTVNAVVNTNLGKLTTELAFHIDLAAPASQRTTYQGAIALHDFELGTWLGNPAVQQLEMQGQIDGKGLSWATAYCQLAANVDKLGYNNYEYANIYTNGVLSQASFQGQVTVDDPNLKLRTDAVMDLRNDKERIAIQGVVDKASLQALQLTATYATVSTKLSLTLQGFSLDSFELEAQLNDFCFGLADKQVQLAALHICTGQDDSGRLLTVDSALVALEAKGNFVYTTLASDFYRFLQGFQRRLLHATPLPAKNTCRPYNVAYQIHCKDVNPLLRVVTTDVYIAPGAKLEGSFSQGETAMFSLQLAAVDTLAFKQLRWKDTQLTVLASQQPNSQAVSATAQLASRAQRWGALSSTEDLALTIAWEDDRLDFSSALGQQGGHNQLSVQGHAVLLDTTIELVLSSSSSKLSAHQWQVHPEHRITIGRSWVQFQNVVLGNAAQQISLHGILSADPNTALHLTVKNFALDNLSPWASKRLAGELNVTAVLQGVFGQPYIESDLTLRGLTIDRFLVGDICAQTNWNDALKRLNLAGHVASFAKQTVAIQGFYAPLQEEDSLQLVATFANAPLAGLTLWVEEILSQLAGEFSGTMHINGTPSCPRITGGASITNGALRINYLNARYRASGELLFADQLINIKTLNVSDDQQGNAVLQGKVSYKNFKDFQVDLKGNMTRLKLLNTAPEDNAYFYGTGILSGGLTLLGPISNMTVGIQAKTEPGTNIHILVGESGHTVKQAGFIRFVNLSTKHRDKIAQARPAVLPGIQLSMSLEITPDAHTTVNLDEAGGIIQGQGNGNLTIDVGTQKALSIVGKFEFSEGAYDFSLYRVYERTFNMLPKSKITWTGSPYGGVLDVKAAYRQRTTLAPLLLKRQAVAQQKCPVQVSVALQGSLLAPTMEFDIEVLEAPSDSNTQMAIEKFKSKVLADKQYLKEQVTSLVVFKKFFEAELAERSTIALKRNMSELLSRQLSHLSTNLGGGFEIDPEVDLEKLSDQEPIDVLQVKIGRSFFDRRLRISREGGLGIGAVNKTASTSLLGDLTVMYFLTQDRRLKAKLYNKHLTNPTYGDTSHPANFAGGLSLHYTSSFSQFKLPELKQCWQLLWRRNKKKKAKEPHLEESFY